MNLGFRIFTAIVAVIWSLPAGAESMRMAVTTSFHNSGLSDILLPQAHSDLGFDIHLIVVGTGQALKLGRAGDVDALLVHSKNAEEKFITEGYGIHRRKIMYNDFVLVGPTDDPANLSSAMTVFQALKAIQQSRSLFVSRGDDSGTHRRELILWKSAGANVETFPPDWYRAVGSGMGATLNAASGMNAYVLSDRASWLKFKNKGDLKLLYSGDPTLFNQYAYLPVNPEKYTHVRNTLALKLEDWLVGEKAQRLIRGYKISGEALFTPNAKPN